MRKVQEDAEAALRKWQEEIKERELAEKRRVAPGWLDREEKILEPQKNDGTVGAAQEDSIMDMQEPGPVARSLTEERAAQGEELDRAFGSIRI